MSVPTAAGEAVLLAHEGQRQIAVALVVEAHRLARGWLAWLGQPALSARPK